MTDILEQAKALLEKTIDPYMEGEPREIPYPTLRSFFNWEDGILRELIAEVEWLRSLTLDQQYMMDDLDKEIASKDARIKELEAYIERLEAAFLEAKRGAIYFQDAPNTRMMLVDLWDVADKKAREALEIIKEGGKDE